MAEVKKAYESMLVVSVKNGEEAVEKVVAKFKAMIEANADLENVDVWGKRRLAYMINKETEGYYVLFTFSCVGDFPAELDRVYNITEGVLRSVIIAK